MLGGINSNFFGGVPVTGSDAARNPVSRRIVKDNKGGVTDETEYGLSLDEQLKTRDKYNAQAEARRQASLRSLMGAYGGGNYGGGVVGGGSGNPGNPNDGNIAFNEQAARDSAFARAKDKAGLIARSSVDSLREMLGGNLGGAKEAAGLASVAGGAANELGDFNREQLTTDLNRAARISDRNYAGSIEREKIANERFRTLFSMFSEGKGPIY